MRIIRPSSAAFTLIELMISIAIVIALMIGVNYVFASVGQATGLTQAVSRVTRDAQGAQAVMSRDFATADMASAPFVVIRSTATPAFRSRADYLAAPNNADPRVELDPVNTGSYITNGMTAVNNRVHRTDVVLFFARDKFARQTGGGTLNPGSIPVTPYLSDMSSQEAMIWYGHLWLPNDDDANPFPWTPPAMTYPSNPPTYPGWGVTPAANPNNFYANQWILGRFAVLLQAPEGPHVVTRRTPRDATGNPIPPIQETRQWHIKTHPAGHPRHALRADAPSEPSATPSITLMQSRYDLAATSMSDLTTTFSRDDFRQGNPPIHPWWTALMATYRFQARPFGVGVAGSRLQPKDVALQAPIFLSNCSQFIVEYAGDFMSQNNTNGAFQSATGDGIVDFHIPTPLTPTTPRTIRWYGFPRDTSGDGIIRKEDGDVVPLRDFKGSPYPFERELTGASPSLPVPTPGPGVDQYPSLTVNAAYTCAWGQGSGEAGDEYRPKMFRIVIAIDDPNGRFSDPLTFEYVFKVP